MRVYKESKVQDMSNKERLKALDLVKTSPDLTLEEKNANIKLLESYINGVVLDKKDQILRDLEEGSADISDMGMN